MDLRILFGRFVLLVSALLLLSGTATFGQRISRTGDFEFSGTIRSVKPGQLVIQNDAGESNVYKIQDADEEAISLGGEAIIRAPAEIKVSGTLPINLLERGMVVRFNAQVSRGGKSKGELSQLQVVDLPAEQHLVVSDQEPKAGKFIDCQVTGRVSRVIKNKLVLGVQKSNHCRQERVTFLLDKDATFDIGAENLNRVRAGDEVVSVKGVELSSGHNVIRQIEIRLTAKRKAATTSFQELLEQKYSKLPDDPRELRQERSKHFILYTDISDRNAAILLEKLETMYDLIGRYYNRRPNDVIECWVAKDLRKFEGQVSPGGARKIAEGAGVTESFSNGRITKSIVYSCDKQGVVQHESVHAFCNQAFGSAGPTWYAEGMAELGQYWRPGELAVNIDPVVIDYLTNAEPKKLLDIVAANQITGDSWQAYAWRWALCYLLATNPNYQRDFKALGIAMMFEEPDATFENAFGAVASEISFEYDQFVKHFGNGYRADLCAWDWETKSSNLTGKERVRVAVKAAAGWQSARLRVQVDKEYDFAAQGDWKIYEGGESITADGNSKGMGKMVGAVLSKAENGDYTLSEPFDLGKRGTFVAPMDGRLFVRCEDEWTELAENSGEIQLFFRLAAKK